MNTKLKDKDIELPLLDKKKKLSTVSLAADEQLKPASPSPQSSKQKYLESGLLSNFTFKWAFSPDCKSFEQGQHWDLRPDEECQVIADRFQKEQEILKNSTHSLLKTQYRACKSLIWVSQILGFLQTGFEFTAPLLVARIISYVQSPDVEGNEGIYIIIAFIVSRVGLIVVNTQSTLINTMLQTKLTMGVKSLIYRKSLKIPLMGNQELSVGTIMNHMLVDVENTSKIFSQLSQVVQLPIMLFLALYIMYMYMQMAFLGGIIAIGVIALLILLPNKIVYNDLIEYVVRYQKSLMEAKDGRMKRTNEILTGIKYIKMSGLENEFFKKVSDEREKELIWLRKKYWISAVRVLCFWVSSIALSILVFGCYLLLGETLTSQQAFLVLSIIMIILLPIYNFGMQLNDLLLGQVSLERLEKFLMTEEIDTNYITHTNNNKEIAIKVTNGNFYWTFEKDKDTSSSYILKNINLQIKRGSFVGIIGNVGSGKSSFLSSLLGEMLYDSKNPPSIQINGSIAYVSQKPWILNKTLKNNVLLDKSYDGEAYREALRTTCLEADLATLVNKDQTEIGITREKGVNLSGGQKARVGLARAVYADSDIYLLDDPLSAVDAHVAKYILDECLTGCLKNKTRVLVTHKLESLRYMDYIYVFKDGQIAVEGDFSMIRTSSYFQEIERLAKRETEEEQESSEDNKKQDTNSVEQKEKTKISAIKAKKSSSAEDEKQKEMFDKLMLNEEKQIGAVSIEVWTSFFRYFGSKGYFAFLMAIITAWIVLKTFQDVWVAYWTNQGGEDNDHGNLYYYGIYILICVGSMLLIAIRLSLINIKSINMARRLHSDMFKRVIRAPINMFFDRVPIGRLINRFAIDLDQVDNPLPFTLGGLLFVPINLLSKFIICAFLGTVWVLPLALLSVWIGFKLQQKYLNLNREVYRLACITASPITSTFAETLDGLTQIRNSKSQTSFFKKYCSYYNENTKNQILLAGLKGWFNFHINMACMIVLVPTITSAILFSGQFEGLPGIAGLLVMYLLDLSDTMIRALQQHSIFESQLISFERCRALTNVEIERESNKTLSILHEKFHWPESGQIEFKSCYAKYRPNLPFVLRDVSFVIRPSEKIGVVGRTGSGKSTLLLSLLRIIELHTGNIYIDGIDISEIGLDELRKSITTIPQDPLLYQGTIRENLDLLGQYSDEEILSALEKVCLKNKFQQFGLSSEVKQGGENLSAGEKQLVCIARAILNKTRIILVDEATSSIDTVTEETILKALKENFTGCTMITIAHRLTTILASDKILVMGEGHVLEFDTPENLMKKEDGHFFRLWKEFESHNKTYLI